MRRALAIGVSVPVILAALLATSACPSSSVGSTVRGATYAPSFSYIDREKLSSSMWRMADDVAALDALLRGAPAEQVDQAEVVRLLADIHTAASGLEGGGDGSNHPQLDQHLADFLREIEAARNAASATPPSYFLAGSVTGACIHCHAGRGPRP